MENVVDNGKVLGMGGVDVGVSWMFKLSRWKPAKNQCMLAICLVEVGSKLLLVRKEQSWVLPCFRISESENYDDLLRVELKKRYAVRVKSWKYLGYKQFDIDGLGVADELPYLYAPYFVVRAVVEKQRVGTEIALVGLREATKMFGDGDNNDIIAYQAYRRGELGVCLW